MNRKEKRRKKQQEVLVKSRLEYLNKRVIELQSDIDNGIKNNKKILRIKNLKFFKNTCNFLAPFVLCTGLCTGLCFLFGRGLPFIKDYNVKEKTYILDYQTDGDIIMEEEYRTNDWYEDSLPANELVVYTPWYEEEDHYTRYKWTYLIRDANDEIINAVLNEDFSYLSSTIDKFKKEKQTINVIDDKGDFYFDAYLTRIDEDDIIKTPESTKNNIVFTLLQLGLGLTFGTIIAFMRDFSYLREIRYDRLDYNRNFIDIEPLKEELDRVNSEILKLSKRKGR